MTRIRPPFSLLAYGSNQNCRLAGIAEHRAELISIGTHSARVRLRTEASGLMRLGETCLLEVECTLGDAPMAAIACEIAWVNGREAGVTFLKGMEISILALQMVITRGLLAREEAA